MSDCRGLIGRVLTRSCIGQCSGPQGGWRSQGHAGWAHSCIFQKLAGRHCHAEAPWTVEPDCGAGSPSLQRGGCAADQVMLGHAPDAASTRPGDDCHPLSCRQMPFLLTASQLQHVLPFELTTRPYITHSPQAHTLILALACSISLSRSWMRCVAQLNLRPSAVGGLVRARGGDRSGAAPAGRINGEHCLVHDH